MNPTSLIPRSLFFGNPSRSSATISPNGKFLSFLAAVEGVMNIWVAPLNDLEAAKPVTFDQGRGIRMHAWSRSGTHLVYQQDLAGDENWKLFAVELSSGAVRALTPFSQCRVGFLHFSYKHPDECLVGLNMRNESYSDVWKVNIVTGELSYLLQNDEYGGFVFDEELTLRAASKPGPTGETQYFKPTDEGKWTQFWEVPVQDSITTNVMSVLQDGSLLAVSSVDRDTSALVTIDLETGQETVLGHDPLSDIEGCLSDPVTETPLAYTTNRLNTVWHALDPELTSDLAQLEALTGSFSINGQSRDNSKWIVGSRKSDAPGQFFLFDRGTKELTKLFSTRPELEGLPLRPMHAVEIPARDGQPLVSYYTLPAAAEASNNGKPTQKSPLVLLVHGGPWGRDGYGFHPWHQWLANRGYAVLAVNYRGSTGFGKNFVAAANGELAGAMHDDLIDAVDWAISQGITSTDQVAIAGGSYGGYATLVGLTFTPDRFVAGIDIVGPSNLVTLIESFPAYWKPFLQSSWYAIAGNPEVPEEREVLMSKSPISRVNDIRSPLLIAQGANDPRVVQAESDQIVKVMEAAGLPVTYALYPDEGHGFARPENNLSFYAIAESFLATIFGLPAEPIGESLQGSSIQVPNGAAFVVGLEESLTGHTAVVKR